MLRAVVCISFTALCAAQKWSSDDTEAILRLQPNLLVDRSGPDVCNARKCLYKCCPEDEYVQELVLEDAYILQCTSYNRSLDLSNITLHENREPDKQINKRLSDIFILQTDRLSNQNFSAGGPYSFVSNNTKYNNYLSESGDVFIDLPNSYERWIQVDREHYCIDYDITSEPRIRFWCVLEATDEPPNNPYYTATLIVSSLFLVLVLVVYCLLPELRNLGGMVLMAYVFSLLGAFVSLVTCQTGSFDGVGCVIISFIIYFFFLSSFCWMNVMSYDIFWTFRGYAKARPIHRRGECFKFIMYGLYGWGVPLAMAIMLVVLNSIDLTHKPWIIQPQIPAQGCFLNGGQKLVYLYIPMLIMIMFNWFFFLMTSFNIWRLSRGTSVLNSPAAGNAAAHRTHKTRFILYLKLSVVMGINWVLEVVSYSCPDLQIWWVSDIYNLLMGFIIFLIFIAKKKILRNVFVKLRGIRLPQSSFYKTTNSTTESNLSQEVPLRVTRHPRGYAGEN